MAELMEAVLFGLGAGALFILTTAAMFGVVLSTKQVTRWLRDVFKNGG